MYALIQNNAVKTYPYDYRSLKNDNPNVSFPERMTDVGLALWDVLPVTESEKPTYDIVTQRLVEGTPILENGNWKQIWNVVNLSVEEIQAQKQVIRNQIVIQVQERLDSFAQTKGYDNIISACSYASSSHPKYGPEGRYCVKAREDTWDKLFDIESEEMQGLRPMPTSYEDIESELPVLEWE